MFRTFFLIHTIILNYLLNPEITPSEFNSFKSTNNDTTLWVTATAYNAIEAQTKKGNVGIGAWGDHLTEEMNAIAVSHDLIDMGLDYKTKVKIEGLDGVYTVMDKMHHRWTRKIDIFMGRDREAAIEWGKRKVRITFPLP